MDRPPSGSNLGDPQDAANPLNRWNPVSPFYAWWVWSEEGADDAEEEC